ncbi:MAG: HAD family hydrolase [Planctomycetota bacterium]|jgi:beta-phosphoglucomutase-like phosphatase (HAD superfamily)
MPNRSVENFDLLIFDMDGVLADTSACHRRAYGDLWRKIGIEGVQYETIAGRNTSEVVEEFTARLRPPAAQIHEWIFFKQSKAREYLSTEAIVYADTALCLAAVARSGIRMALGTGASRNATNIVLSRLGIGHFFQTIVTAEDVKNGKPLPDIYLRVMELTSMNPAKTLIIEDSPAGLEAATESEAYVASVRRGKKIDHPKFIGHFSNLLGLIKKLGISLS